MNKVRDRNRQAQKRTVNRRAAVLLCALACLVIVSALMISLVQSSLRARRETRLRLQMRQTEFLLDAGIMRAAQQIADSADYDGETWRPTDAIGRFPGASVKIEVEDLKSSRRVTVIASLGAEESDLAKPVVGRTIRTHQFTTSVPDSSKAE